MFLRILFLLEILFLRVGVGMQVIGVVEVLDFVGVTDQYHSL